MLGETLRDGNYWRDRAEEAHTRADQMTTSDARRAMLMITESYYQMAERADQRVARDKLRQDEVKLHDLRFGRGRKHKHYTP